MQMWIVSRGVVRLILLLGIEYLGISKLQTSLHRSSINNSASLSNKFGGLYFSFKFRISGLLHHVVTTDSQQNTRLNDNGTSQFKQNLQSFSMTFKTYQEFRLRQEHLEYMSVHDNDDSESTQPSWGKNVYFRVINSTSRGKQCILGGVEKISSTGSKLIANGEDCSGYSVWIPGDLMGESSGDIMGLDGGAVWKSVVTTNQPVLSVPFVEWNWPSILKGTGGLHSADIMNMKEKYYGLCHLLMLRWLAFPGGYYSASGCSDIGSRRLYYCDRTMK
ncbi:hypothetical protein Tco_1549233 [Tanacetum coccineum]